MEEQFLDTAPPLAKTAMNAKEIAMVFTNGHHILWILYCIWR